MEEKFSVGRDGAAFVLPEVQCGKPSVWSGIDSDRPRPSGADAMGSKCAGATDEVDDVLTRRYLCKACGATITVVPRGLAPQLRYHLGGLAAALGLWWSGPSSGEVWRRCSAFATASQAGRREWPSLGRWTKLLGRIMGVAAAGETSFQVLERMLQQLASLPPPIVWRPRF